MKTNLKSDGGASLLATPHTPNREQAHSSIGLPKAAAIGCLLPAHWSLALRGRVSGRRAFTLIELLTVVAVIGILASLLFPAIRSARVTANKASARVQFNQWAAALESFRSEYGFYPALHSSNLVNPPGQNIDPTSLHLFHDILAARRRDASALPAYATATSRQFPEVQNRKLISFHSFSDADFAPENLLRDACGNTVVAVLVDKNLDGLIVAGTDFISLPAVNGLTPSSADFPAAGVRAGVIFYSAAPGASVTTPEFIFSWK